MVFERKIKMVRLFFFLLIVGELDVLKAQTTLASHEFEAENISRIKLIGSFCDVLLSHDKKIRFSGKIEGQGQPGDFEFFSAYIMGVLHIEVKQKGRRLNNLSKASINLQVPEGIYLTIANSSGDIKGEDLLGNQFVFKTTSGDIKLSDVIGNTQAVSLSGDIYVANLQGNGKYTTTSGDKELNNVIGIIESASTSGSTYITQMVGDLTLSSTSGNVNLRELKGALKLNTTSGNISARQILLTGNSSFDLVSGSLAMSVNNSIDDLNFSLYSYGGILSVNGKVVERKWVGGGGAITISGTSASGNQVLDF